MKGYIKLHRQIVDHWIFSDPEKLRAWLIILTHVNHTDTKVCLGNRTLKCKRGQSLRSLDSWTELFGMGWNKSKTRRFLNQLKNDTMVELKSERVTTRLTVCKYEDYQGERNADETQMTRKRHLDDTQTTPNKNDKERVYREIKHLRISVGEFESLCEKYPVDDVEDILDRIENYKGIDRYTSLVATARTWLRKDAKAKPKHNTLEQKGRDNYQKMLDEANKRHGIQ